MYIELDGKRLFSEGVSARLFLLILFYSQAPRIVDSEFLDLG